MIESEKIEYKHLGTTLEAYLAYDNKHLKKRPIIFIFHAWNGRDPFVCKKADFLAELGFVGCALDIYGQGVLGTSWEENTKLCTPFFEDRAFLRERILSGFNATKNHEKALPDHFSAIGFCFGGLCALDLARSGAPLQGVVSFHGALEAPKNIKNEKIQAKMLILHGHLDPLAPPSEVVDFQNEMTRENVDWQVHLYGNAYHSFTNPSANDLSKGTVYNPTVEKRSMIAMQSFLYELYHT